jgi:hypothetical protein
MFTAVPGKGLAGRFPTLLRLRWISSQSVHRTGYTALDGPQAKGDPTGCSVGQAPPASSSSSSSSTVCNPDNNMVLVTESEYCGGQPERPAHSGIRTDSHKLTYYDGLTKTPSENCWEFYDLAADPLETQNVYGDPQYVDLVGFLTRTNASVTI